MLLHARQARSDQRGLGHYGRIAAYAVMLAACVNCGSHGSITERVMLAALDPHLCVVTVMMLTLQRIVFSFNVVQLAAA